LSAAWAMGFVVSYCMGACLAYGGKLSIIYIARAVPVMTRTRAAVLDLHLHVEGILLVPIEVLVTLIAPS